MVPKAPPLMAAVDLPTFDEYKAYAETPPDDSMYDGEGCGLSAAAACLLGAGNVTSPGRLAM